MTSETHDDPDRRAVTLTREAQGRYRATSEKSGAELTFGRGEGLMTPVELLLSAIAGCTAIDIDLPASRRAEPEQFDAEVVARHLQEDGAHRLDDIVVTWHLRYPDGDSGDQVRTMLPQLMRQSRERLCTVSITVTRGASVTNVLDS